MYIRIVNGFNSFTLVADVRRTVWRRTRLWATTTRGWTRCRSGRSTPPASNADTSSDGPPSTAPWVTKIFPIFIQRNHEAWLNTLFCLNASHSYLIFTQFSPLSLYTAKIWAQFPFTSTISLCDSLNPWNVLYIISTMISVVCTGRVWFLPISVPYQKKRYVSYINNICTFLKSDPV